MGHRGLSSKHFATTMKPLTALLEMVGRSESLKFFFAVVAWSLLRSRIGPWVGLMECKKKKSLVPLDHMGDLRPRSPTPRLRGQAGNLTQALPLLHAWKKSDERDLTKKVLPYEPQHVTEQLTIHEAPLCLLRKPATSVVFSWSAGGNERRHRDPRGINLG